MVKNVSMVFVRIFITIVNMTHNVHTELVVPMDSALQFLQSVHQIMTVHKITFALMENVKASKVLIALMLTVLQENIVLMAFAMILVKILTVLMDVNTDNVYLIHVQQLHALLDIFVRADNVLIFAI